MRTQYARRAAQLWRQTGVAVLQGAIHGAQIESMTIPNRGFACASALAWPCRSKAALRQNASRIWQGAKEMLKALAAAHAARNKKRRDAQKRDAAKKTEQKAKATAPAASAPSAGERD
jgi:hypothetical protein